MDDLSFQTSLADLDRGLGGVDPLDEVPAPPRPAASAPPAAPPPATISPAAPIPSGAPPAQRTPSIFPEAALAPQAPPVSRFARAAAAADARAAAEDLLPPPPADGPRPLIDLFPPPVVRERVRGPAIGGAAMPPRIRSRFAAPPAGALAPPPAPLTYEPFYGLAENPFSLSTDPKFIYHSTSHDRTIQELIDALGRGEAMMLLTGEAGTGKTTLCRSLADQLGPRTLTSLITSPISLRDLLKTALVDFGVVARTDATHGRMTTATSQELAAAIGDFAASLAPMEASAVIIVDEAQQVTADVLEPLSALSEVPDRDRRVQVILVGQPALELLLHRPVCRPVEERITVRCRLDPLPAEETAGYVAHRIAVAGASARVEFDEAALAEVHAATRGVPRLINQVCDRALTRGHETSASVIDDTLVAAAAADLGLVPLRSDALWMVGTTAIAAGFVLLMLAGAAAAAWVFRADASRLVGQWQHVPAAPAAPAPGVMQPTLPPPAPPVEEEPAADNAGSPDGADPSEDAPR